MESRSHQPSHLLPVIVGVDGSSASVHALMWAAAEAADRRVPLRIVHAWTVPAVAFTTPVVPPTFIDPTIYELEARQIVDDAAQIVRDRLGVAAPEVEPVAVAGDAVGVLASAVGPGSLLVVGSHGRGAVMRTLLGSVAEGCLSRSAIPVVVVRTEVVGAADGPVVVGVEDTHESRQALRWAVIEAGRLGRRLVVIHAHDVGSVLRPDIDGLPGDLDAAMAAAGRSFLDHLLAQVAVIGGRPRSVAWRVVAGTAPDVLIDASDGASMLVIGAPHPRGALERVLGSTAEHCAREACCPVVVVGAAWSSVDRTELECAS